MRKPLILSALLCAVCRPALAQNDPYLWLEDIHGQKAVEWVKAQNKRSLDNLEKQPLYDKFYKTALDILNDNRRIPTASLQGGYFYNFWRDDKNPRGLWRRASFDEYQKENPAWETLLDIDALGKTENESWVWNGADCLPPNYGKCMVALSRGGKDAHVIREFDAASKSFVKDGFNIPESKSETSWLDENTLLVADATDVDSTTTSGYPQIVKEWRRGQSLAESATIFQALKTDMAAGAMTVFRPDGKYPVVSRSIGFYETENWLLDGDKLLKFQFPRDARLAGFYKGFALAILRSDWTFGEIMFRRGALVAAKVGDITGETPVSADKIASVFTPDERGSVESASVTQNYLIVNTLDNIKSRPFVFQYHQNNGVSQWSWAGISRLSGGVCSVETADDFSDYFAASYENMLTPPALYLAKADTFFAKTPPALKKIKELPPMFDAAPYVMEQYFAQSKDGTAVPYFLLRRKDMKFDGQNPTLLYGYGGFEISLLPNYSAVRSRLWLEQGGVVAVANLRGGGEFGPKWHESGMKAEKQNVFDDFFAVAENLIARKITSPKKLAAQGGSNGGLLMGAAITQRPDLFGAISCNSPLLDMLRYTKLPPGASWISEYGDPDVSADREIIKQYSPYQLVEKDAKYPPVFFVTSTADDRVHPGHARKMAAKMLNMGHNNVFFYENMEGGHAAAADNIQRAKMVSLEYLFLLNRLR